MGAKKLGYSVTHDLKKNRIVIGYSHEEPWLARNKNFSLYHIELGFTIYYRNVL